MYEQNDLADILLKKGMLTAEQLEKVRSEASRTGIDLETVLEKSGLLTHEDIYTAKAQLLDVSYVSLDTYIVDPQVTNLLSLDICRKYKVIPLFRIENSLTLGMVNPRDVVAIDYIQKLLQLEIEPVLVSPKELERYWKVHFEEDKSIIDEVGVDSATLEEEDLDKGESIIKLVDYIIHDGVKSGVSDIHFEPEKDIFRIRYRIDGVLYEQKVLPKRIYNSVTSRIKLLADMDISENRRPQDGRIKMRIGDQDLDIRISTFPTIHGENIVLRVLTKSSFLLDLNKLGFPPYMLDNFQRLINSSYGMILVVGPTGSGKTTTLYSTLVSLNSINKNIITLEDPVEYELPLIRQTQVNPKIGLDFSTGLRSILRQDPDIIMIGEIRDRETAEISIHSALTGHLVFSTLHTNDSISALIRLLDMGIEPILIVDSLRGVLAQRLVRLLCTNCKREQLLAGYPLDILDRDEQEMLRKRTDRLFSSTGCSQCLNSGFKGRSGIFELLEIDPLVKEMVRKRASSQEIKRVLPKDKFKTLREAGLEKVIEGLTSLEEVLRVTQIQKW